MVPLEGLHLDYKRICGGFGLKVSQVRTLVFLGVCIGSPYLRKSAEDIQPQGVWNPPCRPPFLPATPSHGGWPSPIPRESSTRQVRATNICCPPAPSLPSPPPLPSGRRVTCDVSRGSPVTSHLRLLQHKNLPHVSRNKPPITCDFPRF